MTNQKKAVIFIGLLRWLGRLPLPVNHTIGAFLGTIYWLLPSRDRRVVWTNLAIAFPQLSWWRRFCLSRRFFVELGKTFTELGFIWLSEPDRLFAHIKEVCNQSLMSEALQHEKGVLLLTPHFGAWELAGLYWSAEQTITSLYQPPDYPELESFIRTARERMGANLVPTDLTGVRSVMQALKLNQLAGILPDQDPGENGGAFAPFFNKPAYTMVLVGRLAQKSQAKVLFTVCERLPWGQGYRIHLLPANEMISDRDTLTSLSAMNQDLEACVAVNPAQYIWNYKRWKTQPDGVSPYH
ncbi:MAG: lipid A biosynthesis acyltransferase [Proteobacteria bacterium]|nr:lipid A biosynthesis acyltransferase [Pseudomonadota bacterium]